MNHLKDKMLLHFNDADLTNNNYTTNQIADNHNQKINCGF